MDDWLISWQLGPPNIAQGDRLSTLPPETFDRVASNLLPLDLKTVSRVSRVLHTRVYKHLWNSFTIQLPDGCPPYQLFRKTLSALPQRPLRQVKQLQFRSGFQNYILFRCPHFLEMDAEDEEAIDLADSDDAGDSETEYSLPEWDMLKDQALSLLERFPRGQLQSFSWDLGTCVPDIILGKKGILCRKHSSIESLSLTTDPDCDYGADWDDTVEGENHIDLSSFGRLRSLRWRGLRPEDVDRLSDAVLRNAVHLQVLELDLVDPVGQQNPKDLHAKILPLQPWNSPPALSTIRVLSLSNVHLTGDAAYAIDFGALASLTLRKCVGWGEFLMAVVESGIQPRLKSFEVQDPPGWLNAPQNVQNLMRFLDSFEGLEELYISLVARPSTLWDVISDRHSTLKTFVQRERILDDHSGISQKFQALALEFLGCSDAPSDLYPILPSLQSKASLKVLHIREVASHMTEMPSWTLKNYGVNKWRLRDMKSECREFAKWAFGPVGILSLQLIAFGDFAHGAHGRKAKKHNFFLCRDRSREHGFRIFFVGDWEYQYTCEEHSRSLEACPGMQLFEQ